MKKWMQDIAFSLHLVRVVRTVLLFSGVATMSPAGYVLVLHYGTLLELAMVLISLVILTAWWVGYRGDWGLTLVCFTLLVTDGAGLTVLAVSPTERVASIIAVTLFALQSALTIVLSIRWFLFARAKHAPAHARKADS